MKKSLLMLLVLTLIFSTFCSVTVSADATVTRVSLAGNTSFYSSAVPASAKLDVKAYGADGSEISLEGKSVTYKSSRPWVFDIEADGTIKDYGYDGTTIVTATVDGVEGSIIMIKSANNTAATKGFESNLIAGSAKQSDGKAYYGWDSNSNATKTDDNSRIPNEKYIGSCWSALNYKGAWDNKTEKGGADIRVAQAWFYDDGVTNGTNLYVSLANKYVEKNGDTYMVGGAATAVTDGTNGYVPAWVEAGNSSFFDIVTNSKTQGGYCFNGSIATSASSTNYLYNFSYDSKVARTEGWHQLTMILADDAKVKVYIDGIAVNETGSHTSLKAQGTDNECNITTGGFTSRWDDFVFAQNLNTEMPEGFKKTAEKITLSRNKTFIKSVDETASLVVTPLDKNGDEGALPEGTTLTYESSRPWVLDIADDGKFIDGGYDGTTKVTVTASNGMKASTIFIKNSDNVYADYSYQSASAGAKNTTTSGIGAGLQFRGTWVCLKSGVSYIEGDGQCHVNVASASDALKATAKIPGENYYYQKYTAEQLYGTGTTHDNSIVSAYVGASNGKSWHNEGLRVVQGWFYDNGTKQPLTMKLRMSQHSDNLYGGGHLALQSDVKANDDNYYIDYVYSVKNNVTTPITRSKGWHQVTAILNEDFTQDIFVDGELLSSATSSQTGIAEDYFGILANSIGYFDEFVVAANPNTERPVEITVAAGENGTVTYNGEAVSKVATTDGKTVEFEIEPAEGYVIDKITYNGQELTATDGKVSVKAANAILSVIFKAEVKIPAIKTTEVKTEGVTHGNSNIPAAITYVDIIPGNGGAVSEAGILLGFNGVQMALKAYASYTDKDNNTPLTSGSFAIKVYGDVVTGVECTSKPYVKYNNAGAETTAYGEEASFIISK